MKHLTFVDRVAVELHAGAGGDGCCSFRREKFIDHGGPDGGDGGIGGSIFIRASKDESSLLNLYYQPIQRARHGEHGRGKQQYGKAAPNVYLNVPCGTEVRDNESGDLIGEVLEEGQTLLLARGGRGGKGNMHYATPSHQAPTEHTLGQPGEDRKVRLELKTVADVGLVGYPNAGKSTLLRAISPAKPKVAAYPFTTLNPVIGTVTYEDFSVVRVADIPGLIDGAHEGVGLGHDFLRHIERTKFLLFVIDMAGTDVRNPVEDYRNLRTELKLYREDLAERPFRVVANKMDMPEAKTNLKDFVRRTRIRPVQISAAIAEGTDEIKAILYEHFFGRK